MGDIKRKRLINWGMVIAIVILTSSTAYGRDIYREDIPDEIFRNYLFAAFDSNADGWLSDEERAQVTEIIVDDYGVIESVEGIALFPHLQILMCDSNQISRIDVTQNPELEVLTFNHNKVSSIDLSQNPMLAELYCADNQLTTLDVGRNPRLGYLDCSNNPLTLLDISNNYELDMLKSDLTGSDIIDDKPVGYSGQEQAENGSNYAMQQEAYLDLFKELLAGGSYTYVSSSGWEETVDVDKFAVLDIDQDGYYEIITCKDFYYPYHIFAFNGSEVYRLFSQSTFQGTSIHYDPATKTIEFPLSMTVGTDAYGYFKMNGGNYTFTVCQQKYDGNAFTYFVDDRRVDSSDEFEEIKADLFHAQTAVGLDFYDNNSENRARLAELGA